jgi:phospholipid/cholesterol/gamma-HCH transport system substrate-binding protein
VARSRRKKLELWIGLLVIISAVLLTWGYFWLTGQPLGERHYAVYVVLPNAQGLERGDRIHLSGVEVGVVRSVNLVAAERIVVSLLIQRNVQIPKDSRVLLQSIGVFGDQLVVVDPGVSPTFAASGDTLALGTTTGLMDLAGEIGDQANDLLAKLDRLMADSTIDQVHGTVAALPGTVREMESLIRDNSDNLAALSRSLRQTAETLNSTLEGADVDKMVADIEAAAASFSETAEVLNETAESIASIAEKVDSGEGTLGLLVNDPGLYDDLRSATQSLNSLTQDLMQNPGRYLKLSIF